jgi:hypothetical protein
LAQFLEFAQDAHGLSNRNLNSLFRRTKIFHIMTFCNRGR